MRKRDQVVTDIIKLKPPSIIDVLGKEFFGTELEHRLGPIIKSGQHYELYYALCKYYKPKSIIEIGVRSGFSLASMIAGNPDIIKAVGIDDESYSIDSNQIALNKIKAVFPQKDIEIIKAKSQTMNLNGVVDIIHVDGDHSLQGALADMIKFQNNCAIMIVDDFLMIDEVHEAIDAFKYISRHRLYLDYALPTITGLKVFEFAKIDE